MPEIKSQPMPGLCALCCKAVILADGFAVQMEGEDFHELPDGAQWGALQDMASGEWKVKPIKADGVIHPMAAVTFVAGMAACATHVLDGFGKYGLRA